MVGKKTTDEFTARDSLFYFGLLVLWAAAGVYAVWLAKPVLAIIYAGIWIASFFLNRYLACTKCVYYGKKCYMLGGQCAALLYKKRSGEYTLFENALIAFSWLVLTAYPLIVLAYYNAWIWLGAFLVLSVVWQALHKTRICSKCKNVKCLMNPSHK